ncbi:uncharacterized protein PHALS_00773 [Plasmopara halstedii]|uniref:Uncharacterized protein n=1 Tax=Plasmopara halstedii TaxID=4781 RepID=A0A0P1ATC8_PLAHL|nr:uncharacterized protein PHALS_00773 [Plasmopara halstedii]CEG44405.1 hypothetical protein PHALS_00773 [Plasmopara halstedii]|eukprot:XP_024580774.1 hypothetical protein PHALS_00773 [Plasmopara halstedii]
MESPTLTDEATSAMELACNLPALVAQLKALRQDMKRKSKLYNAFLRGNESIFSPSSMSLKENHSGMHETLFSSYTDSQLDPRASQISLEALSALDDANYSNTLVSRRSSIMRQQQHRSSLRSRLQTRTHSMPHMSMGRIWTDNYSVMWCCNTLTELRLVLATADLVTNWLRTTQRPISLGFRTNQNMQTSPKAASSPSSGFNKNGWSKFSGSKKNKQSPPSTRHSVSRDCDSHFFNSESTSGVHEILDLSDYGDVTNAPQHFPISTGTMVQSSASDMTKFTLSDDVERWCKEQEEMHCDIIVILTETVLRCEKLQQENLDQLQNLMQLSLCSPLFSDRSSVTSSDTSFEKVSKMDSCDEADVDAILLDV